MGPKVSIRVLLKVVKGSRKAHSEADVAIQIVRPGTRPKGFCICEEARFNPSYVARRSTPNKTST